MLDQLKELVVQLNDKHDAALGEEPSREIMKIVNAHHQSLAYLNAKADQIEVDCASIEAANDALRKQQA